MPAMKVSGAIAAVFGLGLGSSAAADPHIEIGGGLFLAGESTDVHAAGYGGGSLSIARWEHRIAVVFEAGAHDWEASSYNTWVGVDARIALLEGRRPYSHRSWWSRTASRSTPARPLAWAGRGGSDDARGGNATPLPQPPVPATNTLLGRLWFELGVARELWHVEDDVSRNMSRNRYSIGGGLDLGDTRLFDTIFVRVHRASPLLAVDRYGDKVEQTYETSLVFGLNLMFGL
jgi:hypothetical protein